MNKKFAIIGGVVLLLVLGGGMFLFLSNKQKQSEFVAKPTQWSQAGDYQIKEIPGQQTVVTNKKAGFSFKVPEGWSIKRENYGEDEYFLSFLSIDSEFQKDKNGTISSLLAKGCGISIDILYQEIEFNNLNTRIAYTKEKPVQTNSRKEQILQIDSHPALEVVSESNDPRFIEKFGKITQVSIPFGKDGVIEIGSSIMSVHGSKCDDEFGGFLSSFSIAK